MRYTLRLLTPDQLGRAAALMCALELERQQDVEKLGQWPFEIGLWVGKAATPNRMGCMVDLPNHSVLIAGLDHWSKGGEEIVEPRLVEKLQRLLELPALKLYSPPPDEDNPTAPPTGITAWQFPEWFITQDVEAVEGRPSVRSWMLVHRKALTRGRFVDRDKRKRNVVPVRFVRACRAGHIADIDWYSFVHSKNPACRRQLWIDDLGTSGDLAQIIIRCECGEERQLSEAAGYRTSALGLCSGGRPWLGAYAGESRRRPSSRPSWKPW